VWNIAAFFNTTCILSTDLKRGRKSKTIAYAADPVQLGPSQLWGPFAQLGLVKCDNWKNCYIALSQPHGQTAFKLHKMVLCGSRKAAELWKPTKGQIQDCRRCPNLKYTDPNISGTSKARLCIWCVHRVRGVMQKLGQRGMRSRVT